MTPLDHLIEVLEASAKRNGPNTPVTLGHLLNILKMVERRAEQQTKRKLNMTTATKSTTNYTKTGGPAFPANPHAAAGLTMRDYFAAKAMQGMGEEVFRYDQFDQCAKDAYKMADAMLKARK